MDRMVNRLRSAWRAMRGRAHQDMEVRTLRLFVERLGVDCIFDVGANRGQYGEMLRQAVGYRGRIVSFEPDATSFAALERTCAGDPLWECHNLALSDEDGEREFYSMESSEFSSLNRPHDAQGAFFAGHNVIAGRTLVRTARLERLFPDIVGDAARPFLKMDTQGHDRQVADGAGAVLDQFVGLQTEMTLHTLYEGATRFTEYLDWLASRGFSVSAFVPTNAGHFPAAADVDCILVGERGRALHGPTVAIAP